MVSIMIPKRSVVFIFSHSCVRFLSQKKEKRTPLVRRLYGSNELVEGTWHLWLKVSYNPDCRLLSAD